MFTLKIKTENEAFAENEAQEIVRLLRDAAYDLEERASFAGRVENKLDGVLRDANGNTVGKWELR